MNPHITKAHNHFFKSSMKDLRVASDFLHMHLPQDLQESIDWASLKPQPTEHINRLRNETSTDIVFSVLLNKKEVYLQLIVEHQSTPDILMPFRAENYRFNLIDAYVKQHPETKTIPLIIPIVVYHGASSWTHSMNINDLVDAPKNLVEAYAFKPFIFIDLHTIEDEVLRQHLWSGVMQLALKHIFDRDMLPHINVIMELLRELDKMNGREFIESVLLYLLDRGEMNAEIFLEIVKTQLTPKAEEEIMTISEQILAKGMQQGMQQGRYLEKLETARELLREGMAAAKIADITKLNIEEVFREAEKLAVSN